MLLQQKKPMLKGRFDNLYTSTIFHHYYVIEFIIIVGFPNFAVQKSSF